MCTSLPISTNSGHSCRSRARGGNDNTSKASVLAPTMNPLEANAETVVCVSDSRPRDSNNNQITIVENSPCSSRATIIGHQSAVVIIFRALYNGGARRPLDLG